MTTQCATETLAILSFSRGETEAEDRAAAMVDAAMAAGRAWQWDRAERCLAKAYRLLGAEPPAATGYDWHCGRHPLQKAIERECS